MRFKSKGQRGRADRRLSGIPLEAQTLKFLTGLFDPSPTGIVARSANPTVFKLQPIDYYWKPQEFHEYRKI